MKANVNTYPRAPECRFTNLSIPLLFATALRTTATITAWAAAVTATIDTKSNSKMA